MDTQTIRHLLARAAAVFTARPAHAIAADAPAVARWRQGLECEVAGPEDFRIRTSMPRTLGGEGDVPTPGWYLRAAQASCLATAIVLRAAQIEIDLETVEVEFASESDARGLLGLPAARAIGPLRVTVRVRVAGRNASESALRELVHWAYAHSPVTASASSDPRPELILELAETPS